MHIVMETDRTLFTVEVDKHVLFYKPFAQLAECPTFIDINAIPIKDDRAVGTHLATHHDRTAQGLTSFSTHMNPDIRLLELVRRSRKV